MLEMFTFPHLLCRDYLPFTPKPACFPIQESFFKLHWWQLRLLCTFLLWALLLFKGWFLLFLCKLLSPLILGVVPDCPFLRDSCDFLLLQVFCPGLFGFAIVIFSLCYLSVLSCHPTAQCAYSCLEHYCLGCEESIPLSLIVSALPFTVNTSKILRCLKLAPVPISQWLSNLNVLRVFWSLFVFYTFYYTGFYAFISLRT